MYCGVRNLTNYLYLPSGYNSDQAPFNGKSCVGFIGQPGCSGVNIKWHRKKYNHMVKHMEALWTGIAENNVNNICSVAHELFEQTVEQITYRAVELQCHIHKQVFRLSSLQPIKTAIPLLTE